jgi:hypothetical protein
MSQLFAFPLVVRARACIAESASPKSAYMSPQSISGHRLAIGESGHEVEVELLSLIEKCVPATVGA